MTVSPTAGWSARRLQDLAWRLEGSDTDLVVDPEAPVTAKERPDLLGGVVTLTASGRQRPRAERPGWWPYGALPPEDAAHGEAVELTAQARPVIQAAHPPMITVTRRKIQPDGSS